MEDENAGAGVYSASLKKRYLLAVESWKEDVISEILDGHNVADFIAADIMQRLEELEREEGLRMATDGDEDDEMEEAEHSRSFEIPPDQPAKCYTFIEEATEFPKNEEQKG